MSSKETSMSKEIKPGLTPSRGGLCLCQDCEWVGDQADCDPIDNLMERVAPGEPMPAGQCPKCGALCLLAKDFQ